MGQTTSTQRDRETLLQRNSRRFSRIVHDRDAQNAVSRGSQIASQTEMDHSISPNSSRIPQQQEDLSTQTFATFSRQISAQSTPAQGINVRNGASLTPDEFFYEQQEVRPLVHMEDLGLRDAPITNITASPMPRRQSFVSRLSSRLSIRSSSPSLNGSTQGHNRRHRSARRRLPERFYLGPTNRVQGASQHRFSLFALAPTGSSVSSRSRRRRELAPISRPFPLVMNGSRASLSLSTRSYQVPSPEEIPLSPNLSRRSSRFARVRRSLSLPLENLLSSTRQNLSRDHVAPSAPQRPARATLNEHSDFLLPPLSGTDPNIDIENSSHEHAETSEGDQRVHGFPAMINLERPSTMVESSSRNDRWTDRGFNGRRDARRVPSMLRGRSSRLIRRDNEGSLPQILHLTATAIAAQLSGTPEQTMMNLQPLATEGLDGSLNALFRTLHHATVSAGDRRIHEGEGDMSRPAGGLPPLNFLRVFRFVNHNPDADFSTVNGSEEQAVPSSASDAGFDSSDGRTVTLVVVGVRSVPLDPVTNDDTAGTEQSLDTLLSLPVTRPNNALRNSAGGLLRHADGRSRFPRRRRASGSLDVAPNRLSTVPSSLSESPPGPHPPPSTPAEPGLSAYPSGATTPSRRPSSASAVPHSPFPNQDTTAQHLRDVEVLATVDQNMRAARQRRRSDSEFARYRDLGAGAARRNGVVGPDDVETGNQPSQGNRSWLIYVVGTNLSEDHPAFATPSLFTDNPTYEDMILLSSLLGPVKPPVASREDVESTHGVYRVHRSASSLTGAAVDGDSRILIALSERCLICLCEYEPGEEVRQLAKCTHVYHRECIDEWLTTGRNSCPLCRGQGVGERPTQHVPA